MDLTIAGELRRTFELATLRREAETLRTSRHWKLFRELTTRADAAREREARLFRKRFDTRVEAAHRRLIDAAGTPPRALQPRCAALDRFHPADLLRQAQREVRARHEGRLARIDDIEARALAGIVNRAERDADLRILLVKEFERAVAPPCGPHPPNKSGPARS